MSTSGNLKSGDLLSVCQTRFYLGDLVARIEDWEIPSVFGRLPDDPGDRELASLVTGEHREVETL